MHTDLTIAAVRKSYLDGSKTPSSFFDEITKTIEERNGDVHAYLHMYKAVQGQVAETVKTMKEKGDEAPALCGIPFAIKDNILIEGERTSAASKMLENYYAPYDATIISRLRKAGAVFVGATNMDEFAMGGSTENSAFGTTKNPVDPTRVPGGSSGGSAAVVAMRGAVAALGTDTGGSIRQPASYCGVVGLKPTYGAVSRSGLIAMGSSLDQAGPLTNSVIDAELIHNIIHGVDSLDATTYKDDTYPGVSTKETYRVGVPRDFLTDGVDKDVLRAFEANITKLTSLGHDVFDIELPYSKKGLAAYYIVMSAEVSSNLARYDGMRYGLHVEGDDLLDDYLQTRAAGFGDEVKRRILLGTYVLSAGYYDAYYGKAEYVRTLMREELRSVFAEVDVIITPTAPTPAFKIGENTDPLSMYLQDIFTVPANLTGVPALSVPGIPVQREGIELPVGIQYIAPHAGEARLFDIGKKFLGE